MKLSREVALGRRLARRFPEPRVNKVEGVNVVTHEVTGLSADELRALSEFYRWKYGDKS